MYIAGDISDGRLDHDGIGAIYAIMAATPQHKYVITTRWACRLAEWSRMIDGVSGLPGGVGGYITNCLDKTSTDGFIGFNDDWMCAISNVINGYSRWESMPPDGNPLDGTVKRWPLPWVEVYTLTGILKD